jgi:protein arginine kinase activator
MPHPSFTAKLICELVSLFLGLSSPVRAVACPGCGWTPADIKRVRLFGCGHCFVFYQQALERDIPRLQGGAAVHCGKVPRVYRTGEPPRQPEVDESEKIAALEKDLAEAVAAQRYELAAVLTDLLKQVKK